MSCTATFDSVRLGGWIWCPGCGSKRSIQVSLRPAGGIDCECYLCDHRWFITREEGMRRSLGLSYPAGEESVVAEPALAPLSATDLLYG